jgi:hypothetical protein
MTQHFNIGTKEIINPFENVNFVRTGSCSQGASILHDRLNKQSETVTTRKINDSWQILFDIKLLDFTTLIKWFDIDRGTFTVRGKKNHNYVPSHTVHFLIEDDVLTVW